MLDPWRSWQACREQSPNGNLIQAEALLPEQGGVGLSAYDCNSMLDLLGALRRPGDDLAHGCEVVEQAAR